MVAISSLFQGNETAENPALIFGEVASGERLTSKNENIKGSRVYEEHEGYLEWMIKELFLGLLQSKKNQ